MSKRFGFWHHITYVIVLTFKEIKHLSDYQIIATAPIFAGSEMEELLTLFINIIFECGEIPEILKMGLLSTVYEKKEQNSKRQIIEVQRYFQ